MARTRQRRLPLDWRVRLVLGDQLPRWQEAGGLTAAWVGRLELHFARPLHTRSESCRCSDLRFHLTFGDRWCPLLSVVHPSAADPARTDEIRFRLVSAASGASALRHRGP